MRKIVAPLALLASISLLTSCTKTEPAPVVVPPATETPAPVMEDAAPPTPPAPPAPTEMPVPPAMPATPEAPVAPVAPEVAPTPQAATPVSRTETVSYTTPAGNDSVEFSVTVDNGVITAASAVSKAENEISKKRQAAFAEAVTASVVGKNAKDLEVSAIGGSSLTTGAFKMFVQSF